jgi:predicted nicotinamide N-methyase
VDERDVVEEVVAVAGRDLRLLRPRDAEALLDEAAFEQEEYLPYWAELWPSSLALARAIGVRALRGARTLELGCGLGLPSIAAALAGGRVLATDWAPDAVAMVAHNAERNDAPLEVLTCSWSEPAPLLQRGPWDLVLASDVLYEARNGDALLALLPRLVAPRGEVWLADPGRAPAERFLAAAADAFALTRRPAAELPSGAIHRLRLRGAA